MKIVRCDRFLAFLRSEDATAAIESALMLPLLITLIFSTIDIGNGILANQKLLSAAQMTADLVTRLENPTLEDRANAVTAGQLSMSPFPTAGYEFEVVSIQFDENGDPDVLWRDASDGMVFDQSVVDGTTGLGDAGEGVVFVRVLYDFRPFFTGFVIDNMAMEEVAYMRGRRSPVVGLPPE